MESDGGPPCSDPRVVEMDEVGATTEQNNEALETVPKSTITYNAPNPAVSYGGLNPEIEENYDAVESIPDDNLRSVGTVRRNMLRTYLRTIPSVDQGSTSGVPDTTVHPPAPANNADKRALLDLPSELIDAILSHLSPLELASISFVCRALRGHATSEIQWQQHVLASLPGHRITSPYPCKSWRELYRSHDPYWFLTKNKIWFCDRELTGQMIIARFDERRGCIEGYQLLATRNRDGSEPWLANQFVHIHYFEPKVRLHLDKPILQFNVDSLENLVRGVSGTHSNSTRHFFAEQPMQISHSSDPRFSNFLMAKPLDEAVSHGRMAHGFPYGYVWPPPTFPARDRVCGQPAGVHPLTTSVDYTRSSSSLQKPTNRSEASNQAFRIRQWMEMGPPTLGLHFAEEVVTYSTLEPSLYTPTAEKPWKGIWVGDYSGHGCEFLLMNQPDDDGDEGGKEEPLTRLENETEDDFQTRFLNQRVYRGRLEAIKLTGDPNVPRGEYTFVADDLGDGGLVGVAEEAPFQGARVVKSKGHVANIGFYNDKFIESQLLLISHNRLAQYWVEFGHISFFERVDIDQFLVPE